MMTTTTLAERQTAAHDAIARRLEQIGAAVTIADGSLNATIDLLNQYGVTYSTSASAYVLKADSTSQHGTLLELAPGH